MPFSYSDKLRFGQCMGFRNGARSSWLPAAGHIAPGGAPVPTGHPFLICALGTWAGTEAVDWQPLSSVIVWNYRKQVANWRSFSICLAVEKRFWKWEKPSVNHFPSVRGCPWGNACARVDFKKPFNFKTFKNFRLFFCSDTSKKEFLALMLWTALFFVVITGNWPENEGGEMWSHEMRYSYRDTAFMFDEEPQGVIFSLARAQHWLRHVVLLLGSLSTAACPHAVLTLASSPTGTSASHTPQVFLAHLGQSHRGQCWYISSDTRVCPGQGMPVLPWQPWLGVAAPRDPTESCIVERELPHRECAGWMTLEQDLSDTNALTSNNHILHGQNYLWLKTSEISGNWKSLPFFLMVQWTI